MHNSSNTHFWCGAHDVSQTNPTGWANAASDWKLTSGGDMQRRTLRRQQKTDGVISPDPFSAVAVMQRIQEVTNPILPVQKLKQRPLGVKTKTLQFADSQHWFMHAARMCIKSSTEKSCISHCFQKTRSCSRHHNGPLSFCSSTCNHYLQSSLAYLKNSNMRLIILVSNCPGPGKNSHIKSKGYGILSDMTEGVSCFFMGLHSSPQGKGSIFLHEKKKKFGMRAGNTLGFLFMSHPSLRTFLLFQGQGWQCFASRFQP